MKFYVLTLDQLNTKVVAPQDSILFKKKETFLSLRNDIKESLLNQAFCFDSSKALFHLLND